MSFLFKRDATSALIPNRTSIRRAGSVTVDTHNALTHSAVWAALRLRANLVSTMPADLFRKTATGRAPAPDSMFLAKPGGTFIGGPRVGLTEWLYASQMDLDRAGNCFGIISEWQGSFPSRVDLTPVDAWTVQLRNGELVYRYNGQVVDPLQVWHERQYVVPGLPVGLSPVAFAAMAIGQYLSAQQFALDWFGGGAIPSSRLKNTQKKIDPAEAASVKDRWLSSVRQGEPVVLGADWDFQMISAGASQSEFLSTQQFSVADVCRFFDVPGDLIDAETSTGSVTYANITQRNLQLMVTSLGPLVKRREDALSAGFPRPQFVKLNTDSVLRMDPKTRYEMLAIGVTNRAVTPDEWRALDDRAPLSKDDKALFAELWPQRSPEAPVALSVSADTTITEGAIRADSPVTVDARTTVGRDAAHIEEQE